MDLLEGYGEKSTVMGSQSTQLCWPVENTLHQGRGRSWASSYTSNLAGVERKNEQKKLHLRMQVPDESGTQKGDEI